MAIDIKFSYVCRKTFEELEGDGATTRFCNSCQLNVINIDSMDDESRLELFEKAQRGSERLCISATVPVENKTDCPTTERLKRSFIPPMPMPTAGLPKMPSKEELKAERKRIEAEKTKSSGFLSRFKFW